MASPIQIPEQDRRDMAEEPPKAAPLRQESRTWRPQDKTFRRLAQNREAARKSRLRKKAYVQELETCKQKLAEMEQYLQTARSQAVARGAGAELFDFEYRRWLDEDRQLAAELASGQLPGHDLRATVDECLAHYDEIFQLRATAASSDVFHVITGAWAAPPERCFLWIGGFRPSQILKMLTRQLDPLTELQLTWVRSLWESSQLAEAALSGRLVEVQLSLSHVIAGGSADVAVALDKLSDLRGLLLQADNLRQQTLHEVREILTVRQAARCFMAISEYHDRIRSLGSLWATHSRQ